MEEFSGELSVHYVTVQMALKLHRVPVDLWILLSVGAIVVCHTQSL